MSMQPHVDGYLRWISPTPGDPTYSVLKAHLVFEELLRAYLKRVLPHAAALTGARLTFAQILAVARASSTHVKPDHWIWKAIADLNKLRNMLSHEARPKALVETISEYIRFVSENSKVPFPKPAYVVGESSPIPPEKPVFTQVDLVTVGLYYYVAGSLGFDVTAILGEEERRMSDVRESLSPAPENHKKG